MDTVKVCFIDVEFVEKNKSAITDFIDKERLKKAERYIDEKDRLLSLGGSYLIKKYVGDIYIDDNKKPRSKSVFFNVSHSGGKAAIAVSAAGEVGLDIEKDAPVKRNLVEYCLSDAELESFNGGQPFLKFFVAKESLAKADGRGIKSDIKLIPALPFDGETYYDGKRYFRRSVATDGYFVSVTLKDKDFEISYETIKSL